MSTAASRCCASAAPPTWCSGAAVRRCSGAAVRRCAPGTLEECLLELCRELAATLGGPALLAEALGRLRARRAKVVEWRAGRWADAVRAQPFVRQRDRRRWRDGRRPGGRRGRRAAAAAAAIPLWTLWPVACLRRGCGGRARRVARRVARSVPPAGVAPARARLLAAPRPRRVCRRLKGRAAAARPVAPRLSRGAHRTECDTELRQIPRLPDRSVGGGELQQGSTGARTWPAHLPPRLLARHPRRRRGRRLRAAPLDGRCAPR